MSDTDAPNKVRKGDARRARGNRTGFTTGACAAAAARAATLGLVQGKVMESVLSRLPNGQDQAFTVIAGSVDIKANLAHAAIVKDAGDVTEATHVACLTADVRLLPNRAGGSGLKS